MLLRIWQMVSSMTSQILRGLFFAIAFPTFPSAVLQHGHVRHTWHGEIEHAVHRAACGGADEPAAIIHHLHRKAANGTRSRLADS